MLNKVRNIFQFISECDHERHEEGHQGSGAGRKADPKVPTRLQTNYTL